MAERRRDDSGRGWAYLGAVLAAVVSICANIAHSYVPPLHASPRWRPEGGAVVSSVWWPVALLVAAEILTRTRWPTGWHWALARYVGLLPVAVVAAVVSYQHLRGLLEHYGEHGVTPLLGPLAVDGLMVMATCALLATGQSRPVPAGVDLGGQSRRAAPDDAAQYSTTGIPSTPADPPQTAAPRLRLPPAMRDAIDTRVRQATAEGRPVTTNDVRAAVRVSEELALQIVAQLPANGHTTTSGGDTA